MADSFFLLCAQSAHRYVGTFFYLWFSVICSESLILMMMIMMIIIIIIIIIIIVNSLFTRPLMVCILVIESRTRSPALRDSMSFLECVPILTNTAVCIISVPSLIPSISKSDLAFPMVHSAPTTIGMTFTDVFHSLLTSIARS